MFNKARLLPKSKKGGNHLIFDFDLWAYDVGFAAEPAGDPLPFSYCTGLIDTRFDEIMHTLGGESHSGYLTGTGNYRDKIAVSKKYKAGRGRKPYWYKAIREYLVAKYNAAIVDGIEADDAVAMEATRLLREGTTPVIVSRDKDLQQIPCYVYSYPVGEQKETLYDLRLLVRDLVPSSLYRLLTQVLTGDSTDNYGGLPGVGVVKATSILGYQTRLDNHAAVAAVQIAYADYYGSSWHEHYLEQSRLAFLARELDENGNPVLPTLSLEFYDKYYTK